MNCLLNIGPFTSVKISKYSNVFAKVVSKFCQILLQSLLNCQRLLNFCQSGKFLPNLLALLVVTRVNLKEMF